MPTVKVGDEVYLGQKIAASDAAVSSPIHASVSGKVTAIRRWPHPVQGMCDSIVIESDGKEIQVAVREQGDFVGEMAIFERDVRSATVRAVGSARVLTIDKKNFLRRISEDPSLAFRMVESMSHRIRELSNENAQLKGDIS